MSNKTYTELLANLQTWLEDDDEDFVNAIPEIINLGQMRLWRDLDLSIFTSEDQTPTVATNELLAKPVTDTEVVSFQSLWFDFDPGTGTQRYWLELRSTDFIRDYQVPSVTGIPKYYCELDQDNWALAPIPDAIYTVNTRGTTRLQPLVATTQETNWLSLHMDDILFKACLAESEKYLKADDRVEIWKADYAESLPLAKRETYTLLQEHYNLTPLQVPAAPMNQAQRQ
jgi:hypothetical protein